MLIGSRLCWMAFCRGNGGVVFWYRAAVVSAGVVVLRHFEVNSAGAVVWCRFEVVSAGAVVWYRFEVVSAGLGRGVVLGGVWGGFGGRSALQGEMVGPAVAGARC